MLLVENIVREIFYDLTGEVMLEHERFLIVKRPASSPFASQYEILEAVTQRPVGMARAKPHKLAPLLSRVGQANFLPMKLEAFETEDEPLVFIVRRSIGFLRGQRIADADDHRLGRLLVRGAPPRRDSGSLTARTSFS